MSDDGRISGSQTNALTITSFTANDAGTYYVIVYNGLGSYLMSSNAVLLQRSRISGQPQSVTNIYGTTATFQVTPAAPRHLPISGTGRDWRSERRRKHLGSHTNVLTISGVAYPTRDLFGDGVQRPGALDSDPAVLTVGDPAFVTQPVSTTNVTGTTATFHADGRLARPA